MGLLQQVPRNGACSSLIGVLNWLQNLRKPKPNPKEAQAQFEQGNQARERGEIDTALAHYRYAVALDSNHALAYCNWGSLLKDRGQLPEAQRHLARALELSPHLSPALFNLAMLYMQQGRWEEAALHWQTLLPITPDDADAHYWLANALMGCGDAQAAQQSYQTAIRLNPDYVQARWGYVMAQIPAIAQTEEEQIQTPARFAQALDKLGQSKKTNYRAVGSQQPYFLAYIAHNHRAVLVRYGALCAKLMGAWAAQMGVPTPVPSHAGVCRVGIVSAHIHLHSVWNAIVRGWVEHLNPAQFELHIFHLGTHRDTETEWAANKAHTLHYGLGSWTNWAKAVSDARLDMVIYPEIGMNATTVRLSALRLARVQLASWGHPITTGLPTIDAYLSATSLEPPHAQQHYSERLITLPRLGCCYQFYGTPPAYVSPAQWSSWGIAPNDCVLLCAGMPFKYAPRYDKVLVEIALRCQTVSHRCKLVFFQSEPKNLSNLLEQRLRNVFRCAGLDFDTWVCFIPWQNQAGFFAVLDRADVYLDTIGFSGFNTVMQAVERNTPIVAFEGELMRGRFASAILRELDLAEWVAQSTAGFVDLTLRLIHEKTTRQQLRQTLAQRKHTLVNDQHSVKALGDVLWQLSVANPR